jgi:spermidine synthase
VTTLTAVHEDHLAALRGMPAVIDSEGLRIGQQYVMFFAEAALMRRHVTHLVDRINRPDVLEIGLGLGVFAQQLLSVDVNSYTAVEPLEQVARLARHRVLWQYSDCAKVLTEPWQLLTLPTNGYDAIMYDTWPPEGYADGDFARFVEQVAVRCLRPGGRFSFFHSGDTLGQARRAVLDRHFATWTTHPYTMPLSATPAHWTKPTRDFVVPIAAKEGH